MGYHENEHDTFREIIMDTVYQLESTIDFLKNEIAEKNLLINTLILRNAKEGIDGIVVKESTVEY